MSVPPAGNRQVSLPRLIALSLRCSVHCALAHCFFSLLQVSLRGSSSREITRDALLQKVSEERQLRSHLRRAAAAALSIQVPAAAAPNRPLL